MNGVIKNDNDTKRLTLKNLQSIHIKGILLLSLAYSAEKLRGRKVHNFQRIGSVGYHRNFTKDVV